MPWTGRQRPGKFFAIVGSELQDPSLRPDIAPTPNTDRLRWLTAGAGVTVAHLLLLWSLSGPELPDQARQDETSEVVPLELRSPEPPASAPTPVAVRPGIQPGPDTAKSPRPAEAPTASPLAPASDDLRESDASPMAATGAAMPERQDAAQPSPPPSSNQSQANVAAKVATAPAPARLIYELAGQTKGLPFSADAMLDWRQDGRTYQARMEVSAFLVGSRSQTSSGRIGSQGLQPERFSDRARREKITLLDQAAGLVRHEPGGSTLAMPAGTQDRLSVFIQLGLQMAALEHVPKRGDSWTIPVAATRAIEQWTFRWRGKENLALPAGQIMTWHLERPAQQAGETRVDIWLAPELNYLPARLRLQQENGDSIDQRLLRH